MSAKVLRLPTSHQTVEGLLAHLLHVQGEVEDLLVIGVRREPGVNRTFIWHTSQERRDLAWASAILQGYVSRVLFVDDDDDEPPPEVGA